MGEGRGRDGGGGGKRQWHPTLANTHLQRHILIALVQHLHLEAQAGVHTWDQQGPTRARPRVQSGTAVTKPTGSSLEEERAMLLVPFCSIVSRRGVAFRSDLVTFRSDWIMPRLKYTQHLINKTTLRFVSHLLARHPWFVSNTKCLLELLLPSKTT